MKLTYKTTDTFLKSPDPNVKAVLVYGPDEGLVRERIDILSKTVVDDIYDPFNVVELNGDQIKSNPAILSDEVFSISMMGGRRLIKVRDIAESIATQLKEILEESDKIEHLILIQGGDLSPKSSVRKFFEKSKVAAALPCYVEDERDVAKFLSRYFIDHGKKINADALTTASAILTGDRALVRMEAEKILIYKGEDTSPITIEDITACLGETNAETLDVLTQHMASGRTKELEDTLKFLFSEGTNAVMILRVAQNYFRRLYITQGRMREVSFEQAISKLYPPVFFKVKAGFQQHLRIWSTPRIQHALTHLNDAEKDIKSGKLEAELICNRAMMSLAAMAGKRR